MRIKQFCVSGTKESETIVAHNTWGGQHGLRDEKSRGGNFLKNENAFRGEKTFLLGRSGGLVFPSLSEFSTETV